MYFCEVVAFDSELEPTFEEHLGPFHNLFDAEIRIRHHFSGKEIQQLRCSKTSPRGRPIKSFRICDDDKFWEIYCHPEDELEFPLQKSG